jgi:hypothetical protein
MLSFIPRLPIHLDPFVWFCAFGIIIPPLRLGFSFERTLDYFFNNYLIGCFVIGVLVVFVTHAFRGKEVLNHQQRLSSFDSWRARWYLLNGVIWHLYFDGLVGAFKVNEASAIVAGKVDKRYAAPLGDKSGAGIHSVMFVEMLIMAPMCFFTYFAFYRFKKYRATLEVVTSSLQAMGTIIWILEEAFTGMHSFFEYENKFDLTEERLTYFWFGTIFGAALYFFVPLLCIITAASQTETIVPPPSRGVSLVRENVNNSHAVVPAAAAVVSEKSSSPRKSRASSKKK